MKNAPENHEMVSRKPRLLTAAVARKEEGQPRPVGNELRCNPGLLWEILGRSDLDTPGPCFNSWWAPTLKSRQETRIGVGVGWGVDSVSSFEVIELRRIKQRCLVGVWVKHRGTKHKNKAQDKSWGFRGAEQWSELSFERLLWLKSAEWNGEGETTGLRQPSRWGNRVPKEQGVPHRVLLQLRWGCGNYKHSIQARDTIVHP